jgi:hypothetical protein
VADLLYAMARGALAAAAVPAAGEPAPAALG